MLYRFPEAMTFDPGVKMAYSGKSVLAWFRLAQEPGTNEGFLTETSLVFVIKGTKSIHFPDAVIEAQADDMILLRRGVYFMSAYLTDKEDFQALMLCMDDQFLRSFLSRYGNVEAVKNATAQTPLLVHCNEQICQVRNTIVQYMEHPHEHTSQLLELKLEELFLLMLAGKYRDELLSFLHQLFDTSANTITLTIKSNLLKPLTLEEYAKLCGLSLSGFKREFSRLFNAAPKKWINDERLKHADFLLQSTDKNINEIADECGFENPSYFIKCYKDKFGATPKNAQRTKIAIF
jgi:AraC-like DNA-binding protein